MSDDPQSHKQFVAGVFDRAADTYDRVGANYHDHFGRRLVEVVDPAGDAAWLDVGCGRGAVLIPAAVRVARLAGIDVSPAMIAAAGAELDRIGAESVDLRVMDAERLDFADASFDVVSCAFTLPFLPDPGRALAEFRRTLRPGGRAVMATWGADDPRWAWEDSLWAGVDVARRPARQALAGAREVADLLASAGLTEIEHVLEQHDIVVADPDEWWKWQWSFSRRGVLEQLSPAEAETLRRAAAERLTEMGASDGIPMRLTAVFTLATRAR